MKLQINNAKLLQINGEIQNFRHNFPFLFQVLAGERAEKFYRNHKIVLDRANKQTNDIANKYIQKEENGQYKMADGQFVFNNELDKIQFQKEMDEMNNKLFDIIF